MDRQQLTRSQFDTLEDVASMGLYGIACRTATLDDLEAMGYVTVKAVRSAGFDCRVTPDGCEALARHVRRQGAREYQRRSQPRPRFVAPLPPLQCPYPDGSEPAAWWDEGYNAASQGLAND